MPRTDFSGIFCVVIKILRCKRPVFIPEQTIPLDICRIKLYLKLDILGNSDKRSPHLLHKHLFCLSDRINVRINAIAVVGKRFHLIILDISCPKSKYSQIDTRLLLFGNQRIQLALTAGTHIQITVRRKNHTVVPALNKILFGKLVCRLNAISPVRGAASSALTAAMISS